LGTIYSLTDNFHVFPQVVKLRQDLVMIQTRELGEVQRVYEEETKKFFAVWEHRIVVSYQSYHLDASHALKFVMYICIR